MLWLIFWQYKQISQNMSKTWANGVPMCSSIPWIPADVGNRHTQRFPGDGRCDVWVGSLMRPEPIQDTLATVRIASQPGPSWTVHTIARNKTNMCNHVQHIATAEWKFWRVFSLAECKKSKRLLISCWFLQFGQQQIIHFNWPMRHFSSGMLQGFVLCWNLSALVGERKQKWKW